MPTKCVIEEWYMVSAVSVTDGDGQDGGAKFDPRADVFRKG